MNHERIDLNSLVFAKHSPMTLDTHLLEDVLEAVAHTILFHRALGKTASKQIEPMRHSSFKSVSYVRCGNEAIEKLVRSKCKSVADSIRKSDKGVMSIQLFTGDKGSGWFSSKRELWEEWTLAVEMNQEPSFSFAADSERQQATESDLQKMIMAIVLQVCANRRRVPKVTETQSSSDIITFPVEISAHDGSRSQGSFLSRLVGGPATSGVSGLLGGM